MKAEHRHELKSNELADWLANFPRWFKENLKTIIYVAVVAILVIAVAGYKWYSKNIRLVRQHRNLTKLISDIPRIKAQIIQSQNQGTDYSYLLIRTADELKTLAGNVKGDEMAAMALTERAEILRAELHYRSVAASPKETKRQLNQAKKAYNDAIKEAGSIPALKAKATFGLGLCEEELGNFDEARKIYKDLTENSELKGTAAVQMANVRLQTMQNYRQKVVFQPRPVPPTPPEPNMPVSEIKLPAEINSTQ